MSDDAKNKSRPQRTSAELEAKYAALETDFRTLADSIPQLAWMAHPDGWIFWYNQRWFDFTGTTIDDMKGWGWRKVHHPDHVDAVVTKIKNCFKTGQPWDDTFPLKGRHGEYRWFLSRAMPVRNDAGEIVRWFGTNTDVTEQRRLQENQKILMREIDHRAKNALAVAQAIVNLTRADTAENYKATVQGRIAALARSHTQLAENKWQSASLRRLIRDELLPFETDLARVEIEGEDAALDPGFAQSVALVTHELATNAAKHGALSKQGGRVHISWTRSGDILTIRWVESGGPEIAPPDTLGFGSRLLRQMIENIEGASIAKEWVAAGLRCHIELPLRHAAAPITQTNAGPAAESENELPPLILVVEDEALTALDIAEAMTGAGFRVAGPAGSISAAQKYIAKETPRLAILDCNLQGEISTTLAVELYKAGAEVLFLTGYEGVPDLPPTLDRAPMLRKPMASEKLVEIVRERLSR